MIQPVVKWAGGKRQLLALMDIFLPKTYNTYYEPFLGGGALAFHLKPENAYINDMNIELINLYMVIKNDVDKLMEHLKLHENTKEYYYQIRALDRVAVKYAELTSIERASRFLYLNRTCYNGLYRVNRRGEFNTPYGYYKNPSILNRSALMAMHHYFNENNIYFHNQDFGQFLAEVPLVKGDFVYLDPPYDPFDEGGNFVQYQAKGFGREEQLQLKQICDTLTQRGIKFLLSNSATPFILELYKNYYVETIKAKRIIASQVSRRGVIDEVLVRNYFE